MPVEFDDSAHYGIFMTGTTLTSATGKYVRQSELTLAALRAAGVLDNMVDSVDEPATDKLWLDKNFDPAVLKEWDSLNAAWMPMTFNRLFGRAPVTHLTVMGGTGNSLVVSDPENLQSGRLYTVTPIEDNTTGVTMTISGVGAYNVRYPDNSVLTANEFTAGKYALMLFDGGRFNLLVGYAAQSGYSAFLAATNPLLAVKLNTTAIDGQLEYTLLSEVPALLGHLYVDVYVGGSIQPKDGLAYTITNDGTKILFSSQPPAGTVIYVQGAATFSYAPSLANIASGISNDSDVTGSSVAAALNTLNESVEDFEATGGSYAVRVGGAVRSTASRFRDRANLLDYNGADPTGNNSSTAAIQAWLSEGLLCELPKGDFIWDMAEDDRGMVIAKHNQIIMGHGSGWGRGADRARTFQPHSRIIVTGTGGKIIRSRRLPRLTSGDPQDPATSAALHIAADNVKNFGWCLWLDTDYENTSLSNLGSDIDYGVFVATRTGYHDEDFQVYGNFRKGGVVIDNTAISGGTILGPSGYTLPPVISRGTDAWRKTNSMVSGARRALVVQGAIPTGTSNYYDQTLGLITDTRGSFGASDGFIDGGMYSPDHHSGTRKAAPRGDMNHLLEDENMPCCVFIDGWANNGSSAVQGITFSGNYRIETIEAFHVRLGRANRVRFQGGQFDYQGNAQPNYGSVTATTLTSNIHLALGQVSTPLNEYFWNFVVGASNVAPENGLTQLPRVRLNEYAQFAAEAELRSATGSGMRHREGSTTSFQIPVGGVYATTTASSANVYVSSNNSLQRSTSSGEFKTDVEDLDPEYRDAVLDASRPVFYRSLCPSDNPDWSWYGLIAEEVAAIDPRLVSWRTEERTLEDRVVTAPDEQGNMVETVETVEIVTPLTEPVPDGVFYDRFVPLLISEIKELKARIAVLEGAE